MFGNYVQLLKMILLTWGFDIHKLLGLFVAHRTHRVSVYIQI